MVTGMHAQKTVASQTISAPFHNGVALPKTGAKALLHKRMSALRQKGPAFKVSAILAERVTAVKAPATNGIRNPAIEQEKMRYLAGRTKKVTEHFENALGIDDFLARVEVALHAYGFDGDNTIAMSNLCRDEITGVLKNKIDQIFGAAFNTNGLGGVLTCGVTGMKAGLSHAPISAGTGKERYVFFAFPHIAINAKGEVGEVSRAGRPGSSCACGALAAAVGKFKTEGIECNCKVPGVHDALDPEFSILIQRLARRLRHDGVTDEKAKDLDLVAMTKVAEATIADDLEYLISKAVDPEKADYAVVTGVQIHNYGPSFDDEHPNLEFISPGSVYVVVNGQRTCLNINQVPAMTPRQMQLVSSLSLTSDEGVSTTATAFQSMEPLPPTADGSRFMELMEEVGINPDSIPDQQPAWQAMMKSNNPSRTVEPSAYDQIYMSFDESQTQSNTGKVVRCYLDKDGQLACEELEAGVYVVDAATMANTKNLNGNGSEAINTTAINVNEDGTEMNSILGKLAGLLRGD